MIKIMSDSTCDLSQELVEKYDVSILPLHVVLGDKEYLDGVEIAQDEIYAWADENKTTPKTSAPSIDEVIQMMKPYIDAGDEIITFSISSTMSATNNVMRLAAQDLEAEDRVHVIDSANLSTGIGLLVLKAAEMAKEGKSAAEIVDALEVMKPKVRSSFIVDTLTYLHRGGRCSAVAAMAGGMLKLHPRIVVENGKMDADKKYRGKIGRATMDYVKDMEEDLKNADTKRVFITHAGCEEEVLNEVKTYLEDLGIFEEILITRAGGVVSCHCGYGTLGVLYMSK